MRQRARPSSEIERNRESYALNSARGGGKFLRGRRKRKGGVARLSFHLPTSLPLPLSLSPYLLPLSLSTNETSLLRSREEGHLLLLDDSAPFSLGVSTTACRSRLGHSCSRSGRSSRCLCLSPLAAPPPKPSGERAAAAASRDHPNSR